MSVWHAEIVLLFLSKLRLRCYNEGFSGGSEGTESACNVGDWVLSQGWENPLEEGMATHSSILAWSIPMNRGTWLATVPGVAKSQT